MSNTKHTPTPRAVDPGDHDDLLAACEAALTIAMQTDELPTSRIVVIASVMRAAIARALGE